MTFAIVIGTLIAAVAPLYAMVITFKKTSMTGYEEQLEHRVASLEKQLSTANQRIKHLEDENLTLMRRLLSESP